MVANIKVYRVHSWLRLLMTSFLTSQKPASTFHTMTGIPQWGIFLVNIDMVSIGFESKDCGIFSNKVTLSDSAGELRTTLLALYLPHLDFKNPT